MALVFLDGDGVLADFDAHFHSMFDVNPYDVSTSRLWGYIANQPGFFTNMPLMRGAHALVREAESLSGRKPIIITGLPRPPIMLRSKFEKIRFYNATFPDLNVITCMANQKQRFMRSKRDVLVDDDEDNIRRWSNAGGRTVLFRSYKQATNRLRELFAK